MKNALSTLAVIGIVVCMFVGLWMIPHQEFTGHSNCYIHGTTYMPDLTRIEIVTPTPCPAES